jgi:hypothetical protein
LNHLLSSPPLPIPKTICREIQSLLVKLGDKDPSFIGSSNWIGAIELSYVLGEYLGVTSKARRGFRAGGGAFGKRGIAGGGHGPHRWRCLGLRLEGFRPARGTLQTRRLP